MASLAALKPRRLTVEITDQTEQGNFSFQGKHF
jgi:hypothetical protein